MPDDTSPDVAVIVCDEDDARRLVAEIRAATDHLWSLLAEAHEREAWKALGYKSWNEFIATEFDMSRQRSYQLLHHAVIRRELADPPPPRKRRSPAKAQVSATTDVDKLTEAQTRVLPAGNAAEVLAIAQTATGKDLPSAPEIAAAAETLTPNVDSGPTNEGTKPTEPQVNPTDEIIADMFELHGRVHAHRKDFTDPQRDELAADLTGMLREIGRAPKPPAKKVAATTPDKTPDPPAPQRQIRGRYVRPSQVEPRLKTGK